jgi:hypothetical protein
MIEKRHTQRIFVLGSFLWLNSLPCNRNLLKFVRFFNEHAKSGHNKDAGEQRVHDEIRNHRSSCFNSTLSLPFLARPRKTCAISRKPGKLVKVAEITGISSSDLAALLISPPNFCVFAAALNKGRAAELASGIGTVVSCFESRESRQAEV